MSFTLIAGILAGAGALAGAAKTNAANSAERQANDAAYQAAMRSAEISTALERLQFEEKQRIDYINAKRENEAAAKIWTHQATEARRRAGTQMYNITQEYAETSGNRAAQVAGQGRRSSSGSVQAIDKKQVGMLKRDLESAQKTGIVTPFVNTIPEQLELDDSYWDLVEESKKANIIPGVDNSTGRWLNWGQNTLGSLTNILAR